MNVVLFIKIGVVVFIYLMEEGIFRFKLGSFVCECDDVIGVMLFELEVFISFKFVLYVMWIKGYIV